MKGVRIMNEKKKHRQRTVSSLKKHPWFFLMVVLATLSMGCGAVPESELQNVPQNEEPTGSGGGGQTLPGEPCDTIRLPNEPGVFLCGAR